MAHEPNKWIPKCCTQINCTRKGINRVGACECVCVNHVSIKWTTRVDTICVHASNFEYLQSCFVPAAYLLLLPKYSVEMIWWARAAQSENERNGAKAILLDIGYLHGMSSYIIHDALTSGTFKGKIHNQKTITAWKLRLNDYSRQFRLPDSALLAAMVVRWAISPSNIHRTTIRAQHAARTNEIIEK